MSAFRGARLFASLGQHGLRCNKLHQRRIVSLGLTSLCQVMSKKRALLDTNALPVNKLDLSGVGILSPSLSSSFSTDTLEPTEDGSTELTEDKPVETRTILGMKYPAPVIVSKRPPRNTYLFHDYKIYISGHGFNHDIDYLHSLFSTFGDVQEVKVPKGNQYSQEEDSDRFKFGFVTFSDVAGFKRCIAAGSITTPDNIVINVAVGRGHGAKVSEEGRVLHVHKLADEITVEQVYKHFSQFAEVEVVNLVLANYTSQRVREKEDREDRENYAFVMFKEGFDIKTLIEYKHAILGNFIKVVLPKPNIPPQSKSRCRVVHLSGLKARTTVHDLKAFFSEFGFVEQARLFTQGPNETPSGHAIVRFKYKKDALLVAETQFYQLHENEVEGRLISILND